MAIKLLLTAVIVIVVCLIVLLIKALRGARKANNKVNNSLRHLTDREYRSEMAEKDAQNLRNAEDDKR